MKKLIVLLMSAVLCLALAGCGSSSGTEAAATDNELIGTWRGTGNEPSIITFKSDGTCTDDAGDIVIKGPYTIDESAKTVTVYDEEDGLVFEYSYKITGTDLTLQMEYGLPRTFSKQ